MKKIISTIITSFLISISFINITFADTLDLKWDATSWVNRENYVDNIKSWWWDFFFGWTQTWAKWATWLLFNIAKWLRDVFVLLAVIYLIVLVLRLVFWQWSDDDIKKWRMWVLWTTIWIVVMQMSYLAVTTMFNKNIWAASATDLTVSVINPIIRLLEVVVSFIFIWIAFLAFYRIIFSWWNDDAYKKWINSIIYAIVWFILVKISAVLVKSIYWDVKCETTLLWTQQCQDAALGNPNLSETTKILTTIIKYATWFIWIITILLIVYWAFMLITSSWDDWKKKKAISIIKFIIIWIVLIAVSVWLFNFMIWNDSWQWTWTFN